ncbi:DUF1501 domain-containing protein [Sphingomonas sp. LR60]|uniref:DUF1501 domain-containing protein n=1 Tax=Sphingomonas sp. LR60 TaxID=3050233 RepID=UPI002FE004F6
MSRFVHDQSRRAFLKRSCALGMAGVAAPFLTSLGAIGEAAAATANDYKALVCVFLYGGMDYANTVVPYDTAGHGLYYAARRNIALEREALANTALTPSADLGGGRQYALAPSMTALKPLFDAGRMAVMLNVGTLMQPTTKAQFAAKSVRLPPRLFSHNDQQSFFMASNPEGAPSGWGGRIGDVFQNGNGTATLTCMNATGNAVFLSGRSALSYSVGTGGPVALLGRASTLYTSSAAQQALKAMMTAQSPSMLAAEHATISRRALDTYDQVTGALNQAPASAFPLFPASNSLADQLKMVARMISVSAGLGMRRQVFMVSMGGFDLHDNLATDHPVLMQRVSEAIRAFHDTTEALGVSEKVTTFTASDFGRTLVSNDDGSDHGWGSMHFAVGGAVSGRRFYGTPPEIGNGTASDVGQGRLLPTMAVDQYAATLANWFGVSAGDMATVLPNIGNYDASTRNVGFLG